MKHNWRTAKPNMTWREAAAKLGIKVPKEKKPNMLFEIDGANGEKLTFTEANDVTEIKEGSAVTAEDGEHVFVTDGNTYTIQVESGKVTKMEVVPVEENTTDMSAETVEFIQAVAAELEKNENLFAEMKTNFETLKGENESLKTQIKDMKALMSHGGDDDDKNPKGLKIGNKTIDLTKINLNKK